MKIPSQRYDNIRSACRRLLLLTAVGLLMPLHVDAQYKTPPEYYAFMAQGAIGQCALFLSNAAKKLLPSGQRNDDVTVRELNNLLSKFRYRKNIWMFVDGRVISGFINRRFVIENVLRVNGKPIPSKNLTFSVVHLDRESGIKQIIESMRNVDVEHSWAYIPKKRIWVDTTIAVSGRSVSSDPVLLEALHDTYGDIEIFHTHPESLIFDVKRERNFSMSHLVSGSIPTVDDLRNIIAYAWNWKRSISFTSGVIHPLGVTYYSVTQDLLRSGAGPPIADIGNFYDVVFTSNDLESDITKLTEMQMKKNAIQKFGRGPDPLAFNIRYFPTERLSDIDKWINSHRAFLPEDEALRYLKREN
jgi:hypothetical protein